MRALAHKFIAAGVSAALLGAVVLLAGAGGAGVASAAGIPTDITLSVGQPNGSCGAAVTAFVTDDIGNPVPDNTVVSFTTATGTVLAVTTNGSATAVVPTTDLGFTTVTASAGAAAASGLVPVGCGAGTFSGGPISVSVSCTSTQALVTAFVTDAFGNPVIDGTPISFASSPGSISQPGFTIGGMATAAWTPDASVAGSATITVTVNNTLVQTFVINCGPNGGPAAHMSMRIPQSSVSCGSQAYIFTTATDVFGNQSGGDSLVAFSATGGTVIPAAKFSFGSALSEFTATPGQPGLGQITASSGGVVSTISLPITCG
ncbi:MAG TPA: hypothetical protein VH951_02040 [Dehalococcoidia bacterium]|jgi:hypothetical protein